MPEPEQPEPSGRDLARQALAEYKKRTWAIPTDTPPSAKKTPKRFIRPSDRRDPAPIGQALAGLSTDPKWEAGVAGGRVMDQWAFLCPQYAGLVQPVHYDDTTGRLDLRPGSHSYAAQLRLLGGQLAKQINDKLGRPVVRTIRVLPVGNIDTPAAAPDGDIQPDPQEPAKTRDTASPGYRHTLETHQDARADGTATGPHPAAEPDRQERPLADPAYREPAHQFTDAVAEAERLAPPVVDRSEAVHRAALARKRADAAGTTPRRAFDVR